MVDSAPEVDSALLSSTMGTLLSVYEGLGPLPFTAHCLVLCGTCYASVTICSDSAENCGYSAVAVHRRSSISCRSAEADSHGLAFGRPQKFRSCSIAWWSMFLLCRSCSMPVFVDKCPWFRSCRNSWRFRSRSSSGCGRRCIIQRQVVSRQ